MMAEHVIGVDLQLYIVGSSRLVSLFEKPISQAESPGAQ